MGGQAELSSLPISSRMSSSPPPTVRDGEDTCPESPEIYFEPVVRLEPIEVVTLEEQEEETLRLRAKIFRYDLEVEPPEWKERGTGDVKILRHKINGTYRILMRRDKTLKVCANHAILPHMELKSNCGSERAWVWSTPADLSEDEPRPELLAIRFSSAEHAQTFKEKFDFVKNARENDSGEESEEESSASEGKDAAAGEQNGNGAPVNKADGDKTEGVAAKLEELTVKECAAGEASED